MSEQLPDTATSLKTKALIALSIITVFVVAVAITAVRHSKTFVDATTHQPERYTELYFSDPTDIPVNVPHGTTLPVNFTVHNVEARNMSYDYTVSLLTNSGKLLTQKQQNLTLRSSQTKTIAASLSIPSSYRGRAEVKVTLQNLNDQSIHFWIKVI